MCKECAWQMRINFSSTSITFRRIYPKHHCASGLSSHCQCSCARSVGCFCIVCLFTLLRPLIWDAYRCNSAGMCQAFSPCWSELPKRERMWGMRHWNSLSRNGLNALFDSHNWPRKNWCSKLNKTLRLKRQTSLVYCCWKKWLNLRSK